MSTARIHIKIVLEPWVLPYVRLMDRMGFGVKAVEAVRQFVMKEGLRPKL